MEIYADDHNDLVPPSSGTLVHCGEPDIDAYAQGFEDGVAWQREQTLRQTITADPAVTP